MNYYEQFYDDLEFLAPDEDPYYYRDRYYQDDPYNSRDPYHPIDPYSRENPGFYGEYRDYEDEKFYRERGRCDQDRRVPLSRGRGRGHDVEELPGRGRRPPPDRGRPGRGHEMSHGRGSGRERSGRGRGNERTMGCRGRARGRVNNSSGNARGGLKTLNFVKAATDNSAGTSGEKSVQGESGRTGANNSEQIRFDYKSYQNEPTESEKEVAEALQAYKCHLGFGYGYGPRSDLVEGDQPEWLISPETQVQPEAHENAPQQQEAMKEEEEKFVPKTTVKKAMVNPAFNFVKAKSEFHSIDVAFHEKAEQLKPTPNSLSVNFGNKRVGLGFGVSASKSSAPTVNISTSFDTGMKDGCNQRIDAKFKKLQEAVKDKTLPNKNAIEILHMAVDRVKMMISDEISLGTGQTHSGQTKFLCRLEIDGVFISQGEACTKKAAKHAAYQNALEVFTHPALTVKKVSNGVFELRQIGAEFKVPNVPGQFGSKVVPQKSLIVPGQKGQTGISHSSQSGKSVTQSTTSTTSQQEPPTYSKPKIVFHQPSHPLNNKPLEFKQGHVTQTGSLNQQQGASTPEALATKLLNFVKEGAKTENQSKGNSTTTYSQSRSMSKRNSAPQNTRKRPSENYKTDRLKVQKKGGNVNHSIEDLSELILLENSSPITNPTVNELSVLHNTANFNRVVLKLEYENDSKGVRCSLMLSDIIVAISHGPTKEDAKKQAAVDSLNYLRECCYTIKIKQAVDSDASGLTKEQWLSDIQNAQKGGSEVIPDSNIGNMLLRKMGWVGGGCGKDGKGIAEPVKAEMVIGREGLGLKAEQGIGKNFHQRVTKMLEDYIKSDEQKDLHFSSELSKEERATIHKLGQKLGLKTKSMGKDDNRYLIVSRKRNPRELLEHVRGSGGSTSKYELIPPGDPDLDITRSEDISHGHCKQ